MKNGPVNPMHPSWPVGALSLLLFGGIATAMSLWNIWALGFISMGNAINLMMIIGLALTGFYGFCAVRFYRGLNPPEMTYVQKCLCVLAWFLLVVILFRRLGTSSVVYGVVAMCLLVYLFFAFLGLVMCGKNRLHMLVVGVNTLCGLFGWAIVGCVLVHTAELFILNKFAQDSSIITPQIHAILYNLNSLFGMKGTLALGVALLITAYIVRCISYYAMSPVRVRDLFGKIARVSILLCGVAYVSSFWCLAYCQGKFEQSRINYDEYMADSQMKFNREMMSIDEGLQLAKFEDAVRNEGIQWYNNIATKLVQDRNQKFNWYESATLRWIPAPAADEDAMKQLQEYFAFLDLHYSKIDNAFENIPEGFSMIPKWLGRSTAWRMQYFMQTGNWEQVRKYMAMISRCIACNSKMSLDDILFGHAEDVWFAIAGIVLENPQCPKEILEDMRNACDAYVGNSVKYSGLRLWQVGRSLTATLENVVGDGIFDIHSMQLSVPHLAMIIYTDATSAMNYACSLRTPQDLKPYIANNAPMANITAAIYYKEIARHWQMVSRMNAMKLQICIELYHRKYEKYPETLTQLVPEFIDALPSDPVTPDKPYAMAVIDSDVAVWNYTVGKQGITSIHALRVNSPCGEAVTRRIEQSR